jgi:predicted phage gp36 major capsid-like protein
MKSWNELKQQGSAHYKTGDVEPIDLYKSGDMLHDFALASIIKYAFRSREEEQLDRATFLKNMDKIIHYASLLKAENVAENTANVADITTGQSR